MQWALLQELFSRYYLSLHFWLEFGFIAANMVITASHRFQEIVSGKHKYDNHCKSPFSRNYFRKTYHHFQEIVNTIIIVRFSVRKKLFPENLNTIIIVKVTVSMKLGKNCKSMKRSRQVFNDSTILYCFYSIDGETITMDKIQYCIVLYLIIFN